MANRQWLQSYDCSPCKAQGRALAVLQECSSLAVAGLPPYATRIRADSCSGPAASSGRQPNGACSGKVGTVVNKCTGPCTAGERRAYSGIFARRLQPFTAVCVVCRAEPECPMQFCTAAQPRGVGRAADQRCGGSLNSRLPPNWPSHGPGLGRLG